VTFDWIPEKYLHMENDDRISPGTGRDSARFQTRRTFLRRALATGVTLAASSAGGAQAATAENKPAIVPEAAVTAPGPGVRRDTAPAVPAIDSRIYVNQAGYLANEPKIAVAPATGDLVGHPFMIVSDDVVPAVRFRSKLLRNSDPALAAKYPNHFYADFTAFAEPGRYRLRLSDGHLSAPFSIGSDIYDRLIPLVMDYFDVQLCGEQHSEYRGTCHTDDGIISGGPRDGQRLETTGGWHDAGDYIKFVETTSYVTAVMLFAIDHYGERYTRSLHARHSPGRMPVPLQYAKIGLDWLLKMHPKPDEFYYQVGDEKDHDVWRLAENDTPDKSKDWKPRTVFYGVGANLAGRCAAAFAAASRLYHSHDRAFAARCLAAAKSVYELGVQNPVVLSTKPADFYPESTWADDMEWGAIELYRAAKDPRYLTDALAYAEKAGASGTYTSVYNTHAFAHYILYKHAPVDARPKLLEYLRTDADDARTHAAGNPYGLGTPLTWGTAEAAAGAAITCLLYSELSVDRAYEAIARAQRDYLMGVNPFSLCCLIGAGTRYALFPHHQIANIRNIELTGAIVGGPSDAASFDKEHITLRDPQFVSQAPAPIGDVDGEEEAGVYHDVVEDYVTNEPANDYTVKFLLMALMYAGE